MEVLLVVWERGLRSISHWKYCILKPARLIIIIMDDATAGRTCEDVNIYSEARVWET